MKTSELRVKMEKGFFQKGDSFVNSMGEIITFNGKSFDLSNYQNGIFTEQQEWELIEKEEEKSYELWEILKIYKEGGFLEGDVFESEFKHGNFELKLLKETSNVLFEGVKLHHFPNNLKWTFKK